MREIEDHPVVSSLSFIRAIGRDKVGYRVNLRCGCKQVGPVRMSSKRPTLQDCLRELGRLIQQDHGPTCVAAAQELQAVVSVLAAERETRTPVTHRRRRSEVSEEEFERRQALVKHQSFWS